MIRCIEWPGGAPTPRAVAITCERGDDMAQLMPPEERLTRKLVPELATGCLVWTGYRMPNGYGLLTLRERGKNVLAHRLAYELWVGPIPAGLQIDHLCRNRACCNVDHLEAVTGRTNVLRGEGLTAKEARQTHCLRGHLFDAANTYMRNGTRQCRACHRRRERERQRAQTLERQGSLL